MKHIVTAVAIAIGLWASAVSSAEQTTRVAVSELSCPSCVYIVSTAMREVPSVDIEGFTAGESWSEGTFVVTYDDETATPEMIAEAVRGYGYPALVVTESGS